MQEYFEDIKFMWATAITSSGALLFTLVSSMMIILRREYNIGMMFSIFLLIMLPIIGAGFYHYLYKSFFSRDKYENTEMIRMVLDNGFDPKTQFYGLLAICALVFIAVVNSFTNMVGGIFNEAVLITSLNYIVGVLVYNSTLSYLIVREIEDWEEDSLYSKLYKN